MPHENAARRIRFLYRGIAETPRPAPETDPVRLMERYQAETMRAPIRATMRLLHEMTRMREVRIRTALPGVSLYA